MLTPRSVPLRPRAAFRRPACLAPLAACLAAVAATARAQEAGPEARADGSRADPCEAWEDRSGERQYAGFACVRRTRPLTARPGLGVDAGPNGMISVRGDGGMSAPVVTATVTAYGPTDADAARTAAAVEVVDDGGTLRARGPARRWDARGRDAWWSVDWRAAVPRRTDLDLRAVNGGLHVAGVVGRLQLYTRNGGIVLDSVGGDVRGRAANGGVVATLDGARWDPAGRAEGGLDLESDNGGAVLRVPAGYSARVSFGRRNGPLAVDVPVELGSGPSGAVTPNRLDVTLGAGGAPVRVLTGNGGARLARAR